MNIVAANLILLNLLQSLSLALLSYHIGFKSKNHNHHKLFMPSNGGLICKPAKPDSHTKRKIPAFRDSIVMECHC